LKYKNQIGSNVFYTFAVVCKESCEKIIKDKVYYACQIDMDIMKETYCIYREPYIGNDSKSYSRNYIGNYNHKYFISPAEWRDIQIEKILDEKSS
jgi:hypothetical protein